MVKEVKLKKPQHQIQIMNRLWSSFPEMNFKKVEPLKSIPNSAHYQIKAKDKSKTGTIEIILDPRKQDRIRLKVAKNRRGNWAYKAKNELIRSLG